VTNRGIKRHENKTGLNELAVKKSRSKTVKFKTVWAKTQKRANSNKWSV